VTGKQEKTLSGLTSGWLEENGLLRLTSGYYELFSWNKISNVVTSPCQKRLGDLLLTLTGGYYGYVQVIDINTGGKLTQPFGFNNYESLAYNIRILDNRIFYNTNNYNEPNTLLILEPSVQKLEYQIGSSSMVADGKKLALKTNPEIIDGNFYIPVESFIQSVGGTLRIESNSREKSFSVYLDQSQYYFKEKSPIYTKNENFKSKEYQIDAKNPKVAAQYRNGQPMLPAKLLCSFINLGFAYDSKAKRLSIDCSLK
jgi:hypothetical protein